MFQMKSAHYLHNNNLHNEDGGKIEIWLSASISHFPQRNTGGSHAGCWFYRKKSLSSGQSSQSLKIQKAAKFWCIKSKQDRENCRGSFINPFEASMMTDMEIHSVEVEIQ